MRMVLLLLPWALPFPAQAHLASSGLGPFYDGALHLWLSPEQWLGILALGLLAGLGGARHSRVALVVLPAAWMAGGLIALGKQAPAVAPYLPALVVIGIGLLVALDWPGPAGSMALLGLLVGGVNGYLGGLDAAGSGIGLRGLLGTGVAVFLGVVLPSATAVVLARRAVWTRVGLRVAGSWLAAVGLLMCGWMIRQGG
jgi:hypothetical protein